MIMGGAENKDGIEFSIGDESNPNMARIPDADVGESLKRLCKNDDIKECLYNAVDGHKKMSRGPWKDHAIQGLITVVALVVAAIIGKYFF